MKLRIVLAVLGFGFILLCMGSVRTAYATFDREGALPGAPLVKSRPMFLPIPTPPSQSDDPPYGRGDIMAAIVQPPTFPDWMPLGLSPSEADQLQVDAWHGDAQRFGHLGTPTDWINVLGNVSGPNPISSLTYSLNGGAPQLLAMGPNLRRLARTGDFNVEFSLAELDPGDNQVSITAQDTGGTSVTKTVALTYASGNVWPLPFQTDWAATTDIQANAQVVDGKWGVESTVVHMLEPGYDRVLAIGDLTWSDYEVTVPLTVHAIDETGYTGFNYGPAVGLALHSRGYYQMISEDHPYIGWDDLGALGWYHWFNDRTEGLEMLGYGGDLLGTNLSASLQFDTPYIMKARVESQAGGTARYSLKLWPAAEDEPEPWGIEADGSPGEPSSGSLLLVAHWVDVSFGDVSITEPDNSNPSLTVIPAAHGTVDVNPDKAFYDNGEQVEVTAHPDDGYELASWGSTISDNSNPLVFNITSNTVLRPLFSPTDGLISDDFNSCKLNDELWSFVDPVGDASYQLNGTQLEVTVPAGTTHDLWTGSNGAARLLQATPDQDFGIEAKFESIPSGTNQLQGIVIQQDINNFIRADFYSDTGSVYLFAAAFEHGVATEQIHKVITPPSGSDLYLRLTRTGNSWTEDYSFDGDAWTTGGTFAHELIVTAAGPFAGNAGDNPAYTARVDYFFNRSAPISPEDAASFGLGVSVNGEGQVLRTPSKESYTCDEPITLTATPATEWEFSGWDGALSGSTSPATLQYDVGDVVTATFTAAARYTLTVGVDGNGAVEMNPDQPNYALSEVVTLTATADSGWMFKEWQGDVPPGSTDSTLSLIMNSNKSVTAVLEQLPGHTLTTNMVGQGSIGKTPDLPRYTDKMTVTLTATADVGWTFKEWQGDVPADSVDPTLNLTMDGDKLVTAVFEEPAEYVLTANVTGQGSVSKTPDLPNYAEDTAVTVVATPAAEWVFKEWQGDIPTDDIVDSENQTLTLIMNGDKTVVAVFEQQLHIYLPIIVNP